jgi:hypothetical protein
VGRTSGGMSEHHVSDYDDWRGLGILSNLNKKLRDDRRDMDGVCAKTSVVNFFSFISIMAPGSGHVCKKRLSLLKVSRLSRYLNFEIFDG